MLFVTFGLFGIRWLGIPGLGLAYVTYAIFTVLLFATALATLDFSPPSSWVSQPIRAIIGKTLRFNLGYFVLSICQLLMDPVCKILIGQFSSLEAVAIFDLANKITTQARVIYQAATQSILPLVSREGMTLEPRLRSVLLGWNKLIAHCALYSMSAVVLLSGHIAIFILGKIHPEFITYVAILAFANALNAVGLVGYYIDVGSGRLKHLLGAFIGMAALNVMLGGAFGLIWGAMGITLGYAIALTTGGLACSKSLITSVIQWLFSENLFEIALFLANSFVALYAMAWLKYENPIISTFFVLTMLAVTAASFAIRELGSLRSRLG
jgi:O-antigen/teichoic acid export membrane protein